MTKQPERAPVNDRSAREVDRSAEQKRQAAVRDAVHDATHDAKGNPTPLGMVLIEGKP